MYPPPTPSGSAKTRFSPFYFSHRSPTPTRAASYFIHHGRHQQCSRNGSRIGTTSLRRGRHTSDAGRPRRYGGWHRLQLVACRKQISRSQNDTTWYPFCVLLVRILGVEHGRMLNAVFKSSCCLFKARAITIIPVSSVYMQHYKIKVQKKALPNMAFFP